MGEADSCEVVDCSPSTVHPEQVKLFDTTLPDGQQCPGAGMSFERNLQYAKLAFPQLAKSISR